MTSSIIKMAMIFFGKPLHSITSNVGFLHFQLHQPAQLLQASKSQTVQICINYCRGFTCEKIARIHQEVFIFFQPGILQKLNCCNGWDFLSQFLCNSHPNSHHSCSWSCNTNFNYWLLNSHQFKSPTRCPNKVGPYLFQYLKWNIPRNRKITVQPRMEMLKLKSFLMELPHLFGAIVKSRSSN